MILAQSITDVSVQWPALGEVLAVLTLRAGYNSAVVVIGTMFLGAASGIVGSFALLRKRALMGDALSHAALPGLAIAFMASVALGGSGRSLPVLLLGATCSGVLGVLAITALTRYTRLAEDAAIAAVLSVFFGFGLALLSIIQAMDVGTQGGLHHFIYGQTAAMSRRDAEIIAAAAGVSLLVTAALFKELGLLCFDADFARVQGWPAARLDLALMSLVVVVTVIGLSTVGLILSIALLIIPAAAARFWTERLSVMVALSCAIGALSGYLGSTASALLPRLPAGAVIVLVAGALFLVSFLFAPCRGVVAGAWRRVRVQSQIAREHLLRGLFERIESAGAARPARRDELQILRGGAGRVAAWWLARRGLIRRSGDALLLTDAGMREAMRVTRNHRLWEEYLVAYAQLAPSHVDRSADMVEHVLSAEMVAQLDEALRRRGTMPVRPDAAPPSVHSIEAPR